MENNEIIDLVHEEFEKWQSSMELMEWRPEFSEGAVKAIGQMVINIVEDPSPSWMERESPEMLQRYAISIIPNILNDITRRFPYSKRLIPMRINKITSWEIWHGISDALEQWCPIPKRDF